MGEMARYRDQDGDHAVCAKCGEKGVATGYVCYVRRAVVLIPLFQFEPEARYIADRNRIEADLAGLEFTEGILCAKCAKPASTAIIKGTGI